MTIGTDSQYGQRGIRPSHVFNPIHAAPSLAGRRFFLWIAAIVVVILAWFAISEVNRSHSSTAAISADR
jgi:hypothetical protein